MGETEKTILVIGGVGFLLFFLTRKNAGTPTPYLPPAAPQVTTDNTLAVTTTVMAGLNQFASQFADVFGSSGNYAADQQYFP